jgi:ABC-2 type transport system ATP-binding protein
MSEAIIQLDQVTKKFGDKQVLKGLSFQVYPGELIALLGCNGAGKTTTMNIMLGLEKPDSGSARLFGYPPGDMKVRQVLGVTPQGTDFPEGLTVKEILTLVAAHYSRSIPVDQAVKQFLLTDIADQITSGLSYGQKRRVAVALSFIGQPKCIFLDEPTTGLDAQSRRALWSIINDYVAAGGSLVLTTHYLEEAEKLASRVLVLEKGVIGSQGTVEEIIAETGMLSVSYVANTAPEGLKHAASVSVENGRVVLETTNSDALIRELVSRDVQFEHLMVHKSSLETAFLNMNQTEGEQ